ncbi:unnamed protein product [Vicia faba]|uniref:B-like cyclin n=1 Tax=Vicia faba TaxID=3906 RepID=A0AAV0ZM46_VICFA|nr:unnamed protein product [Vicia faba]
METRASKKRANTDQKSQLVVPKRQRVAFSKIPNLNFRVYNKTNVKCDHQLIIEPYVSDIDHHHRTMEKKRRPIVGYIEDAQKEVTINMRGTLVDWLMKVADEHKLLPETLHLCISYIDRFLSLQSVPEIYLALLGVSSMFIASKYEEITPPKAVAFCKITENAYHHSEVLKMEAHILKSLNYEVGNPNVTTFLKRFIGLANGNQKNSNLQFEYLCNYLADLSLLEYECIRFLPSVVAASVIFLARFIIQPEVHPWTPLLCESLGYKSSELKECVVILHDLYFSRREAYLKTLRNKFNLKKFKCVANLPSPPEVPTHYFKEA